MGKPFKIILSIIVGMVFLIVLAVFALPFIIDPNGFKPEIAAAVKNNTGRDLTMLGDLKLSVFPWLGVSTGKMTLSNATGFQEKPFATLEESGIKVKLLPLLTKEIEISRIVLKGLTLNLAKNQQAESNWKDLTSSDAKKTTSSPSANKIGIHDETQTLPVLATGGIVIENAQINWDDESTGKHLLIKDINLNADKFSYDKPSAIDLSLVVLKPETKFTESIKLTAQLTVNEKLDTFALSQFNLQTKAEGQNVLGKSLTVMLTATDISLDKTKQTVKASGLRLKTNDLMISAEITGDNINGNASFQGPVAIVPFSPAKLLKGLGIAVPVMQDANALNNSTINFNLLATENLVDLQNLVATLDGTQIHGSTSIKDFRLPEIAFNLTADTIDVDRYLPPATDKSPKPMTSPAVALAAGAYVLPVEFLRKLNVNGQLSLGKLRINRLFMQDAQLNLSAKNGTIKMQQSANRFYQGSYNGSFNVDVRNKKPTMALNEKVTHLQVESLLNDFKCKTLMSGIVDASAQLKGEGNSASELKSSLNGDISFLFKDSVVKGFSLQKIIDQAKALIKEPAMPINNKNDQTLFSEIKGTATINNGLIHNNDLFASASKIHINGKGDVDLNTEKLDYKISALLVKANATATELEQIHDIPINITIAGTFSNPTYTFDIASLLTEKNKAKIEKFVEKNQEKIDNIVDKIDKKLGPKVGDLLKGLFKKHN